MATNNEPLNQLIEAIRAEGSYVFASSEDADFYRKLPAPAPIAPAPLPLPLAPSPAPLPLAPAPLPLAPAPLPVSNPIPVAKPPTLTPLPAKEPTDFSSLRKILATTSPTLTILNEIPPDLIAHKLSMKWKTKNQTAPISILLFQEPPEQRALLEQIAIAIDIYFGPAKIVYAETIEKEKQWEAFLSVKELKTIIACDYSVWQMSSLMKFYKETPASATRTLGTVPLFLLPNLELYLKDPLLKRSLWKALCQKFS